MIEVLIDNDLLFLHNKYHGCWWRYEASSKYNIHKHFALHNLAFAYADGYYLIQIIYLRFSGVPQ